MVPPGWLNGMTTTFDAGALTPGRQAVTADFRVDEGELMTRLVGQWRAVQPDAMQVKTLARQLVQAVRDQRSGASGVDHLMQRFSLSSQEGVALMCLAEALLRIPDSATADRLIRDKLAGGNWRAHLGGSPSLFVNAATWGLMITGKLASTHSSEGLGAALTRLIAKSGEPVIRAGVDFAMRLLGQQFVMGETIAKALRRSESNEADGYAHSFDMLGEAALTVADADRYLESYRQAIMAVGEAARDRKRAADGQSYLGISIKLSALHPRYVRSQRARVMSELLPRLVSLLELAKTNAIDINIDAEEADRLDLSLDLLESLAFSPSLAGWNGLGFVVQAYQKRCPALIDYVIDLARRSSRRFPVRLVKGAYWDSEVKRAQVDGLSDYPVFTRKANTDLCYLVCAAKLLKASDAIFPQFATHNAYSLAAVRQLAVEIGNHDYEFQCLHGMGEPLYDNVVGADTLALRCRIYAPVGSHETLLPYLVRRLLENGANSSFVNRIVDPEVSIDELVVDPLDEVLAYGLTRHPAIPLPPDLFGVARRNSVGFDFANEVQLAHLSAQLEQARRKAWTARPQVAYPSQASKALAKVGAGGTVLTAETISVSNPADAQDAIGIVHTASGSEIEAALAAAAAYVDEWRAMPVVRRAAMLEHTADLLEAHRVELISLCVREGGKSWTNAVAEIREAVDFCRYYARQARHLPASEFAPGVTVCISPWNFPLAIFLGQVTAALAAGSPVIAKPAEQTALIAGFAIDLLHQAGIPFAAVQCLPGRGETVGAALVGDERVRGITFTGSTEVAQLINRTLASRSDPTIEVRLVAETGGQNVMIVDSTALLEQVVQDAISSGFDSAGQRCSALRVLCVQEEVADRLCHMLTEAMAELRVGDPRQFATDIGPVIDEDSQALIVLHIERMRSIGAKIHQLALPADCATGNFVAPTVIEIASIDQLQREVFGPVIHLLRYRFNDLDALLEQINATGYGLTLGIHSRIDETIERIISGAHVGNVYVNRNIIGAVVGVQPFGGEGKSGTGPKAGGPLYVARMAGLGELPDLLDAVCETPADNSLLTGSSWLLPGPTGERNSLRFVPRGQVLCIAHTTDDLRAQLKVVAATGNTAVCPEEMRALTAITCAGRVDANGAEVASIDSAALSVYPLAAVLCATPADELVIWRKRMAAREGPLVPVITPAANGQYAHWRLLAERVVSVNTTAAGGNTALMTLGV